MESSYVYQVFEISSFRGKRAVSKQYPTWLGCHRVRNRIARDNYFVPGVRYVVQKVKV